METEGREYGGKAWVSAMRIELNRFRMGPKQYRSFERKNSDFSQ